MKYITKKVIKGNEYYYFQYKNYTELIGKHLPQNLGIKLLIFFNTVGEKEFENVSKGIKEKFKYGNLKKLESLRHTYIALKHDLLSELNHKIYKQLMILFTYHSNRSEGSKTTKKEIKNFKEGQKIKTKTDQEINNSFKAFRYSLSDEMKWNMKSIKHIHKLLLNDLDPIIAGKWKNENNTVSNQKTTDYKEVSKKMKELVIWLRELFKKDIYPPELALKFYCKFEKIHPFLDGNGRVGRILLNAILYKFNYPPVIFFSENHQEHCTGIQQALEGRWNKMYKHFLKQVDKTNAELSRLIRNN